MTEAQSTPLTRTHAFCGLGPPGTIISLGPLSDWLPPMAGREGAPGRPFIDCFAFARQNAESKTMDQISR